MFDIFIILTGPIYMLLIIQLDRLYPKIFKNYFIYYAWAISFCHFLVIVKIFLFAIKNFYSISAMPILYSNYGTWLECSWLHVDWLFCGNYYEIIMLCIVTLISSMVQLYGINYMIFDDYKKFTTYIALFTFFMIILVSSGNFLVLFLGWEGVGLCSYLLINFWFTRINANLAAMKALIVNRIADMALVIGIILISLTFLSLDFDIIFSLLPFFLDETIIILNYDINIIALIGFLIFIGAMGKSAQLGLHTWLPDAMEGPTPVSALIHAATMVTAGVFLIIKCSPIFEHIPHLLNLIVFIGAFTSFFSALIGLVQNDIKKIIAYSTCSQLGYMIFCCGLSAYDVSFFHLINHAFFKALLFLSAGALIHGLSNEQDLRRYGISLKLNAPYLYITFIIGSLALIGFPFLTGFYSKDIILEIALTKYTLVGTFSYFIGINTAFLTAIYSFRIIYLTFIFEKNMFRRFFSFDTSIFFTIPLFILAIGSLIFGYFTKDLFIGLGSDIFASTIYILPENNIIYDAEFFGWINGISFWWLKLLPFLILNLALLLTVLPNYVILFQRTNYIYILLSKKFFFDIFYNKFIVNGLLFVTYDYIYKYFDKIILELLGPTGFSTMFYKISYYIRNMHCGVIFIYVVYYFILIMYIFYIPFFYNEIFGTL